MNRIAQFLAVVALSCVAFALNACLGSKAAPIPPAQTVTVTIPGGNTTTPAATATSESLAIGGSIQKQPPPVPAPPDDPGLIESDPEPQPKL